MVSNLGHLWSHTEPKIGSLLLTDLSAVNVCEIVDRMLLERMQDMVKKYLIMLHLIIRAAHARGLNKHNIARDVRLGRSVAAIPRRPQD